MLVITITIENPEASITDSKGITHNSSTTITKVLETTSDLSVLLSDIGGLLSFHIYQSLGVNELLYCLISDYSLCIKHSHIILNYYERIRSSLRRC